MRNEISDSKLYVITSATSVTFKAILIEASTVVDRTAVTESDVVSIRVIKTGTIIARIITWVVTPEKINSINVWIVNVLNWITFDDLPDVIHDAFASSVIHAVFCESDGVAVLICELNDFVIGSDRVRGRTVIIVDGIDGAVLRECRRVDRENDRREQCDCFE